MVKVAGTSIRWTSISLVLLLVCSMTISQEESNRELIRRISKGPEQFALELFEKMTNNLFATSPNNNIIISPISVWSLLLLVAEGAGSQTLSELQVSLRLFENIENIRNGFRAIQDALNVNTTTVELAQVSGAFYPSTKPLLESYQDVIRTYYRTSLVPVNFANPEQSLSQINEFVRQATRNQIKKIVEADDVRDAALILASAIYFRGEWKIPFNDTLTAKKTFFNENNEIIGSVNMMSQTNIYPYVLSEQLSAFLLEIPYGKQDRLSMIILLPKKNIKLRTVVKALSNKGVQFVVDEIRRSVDEYGDTEIEVHLPRFAYKSSYNLNSVLSEMGIKDVFNVATANLTRMSNEPLYLSKVMHQAKIRVNEKGTVAAAVTTGSIMYKQTPQKFVIDRPFAYLIVDKATDSVLFMGSVVNPVKQDEEENEENEIKEEKDEKQKKQESTGKGKNRSNQQKYNVFVMLACTGFIALYTSVVLL